MAVMASVGIKKTKRTFMKKEYVKPEMVVEQFMAELAFLGGSQTEVGGGEGPRPDRPMDTNEHRGGWGDLWN